MSKEMIGRQVRNCRPGGFTQTKAAPDPRCSRNNAVIVREAANRVLDKRAELNPVATYSNAPSP